MHSNIYVLNTDGKLTEEDMYDMCSHFADYTTEITEPQEDIDWLFDTYNKYITRVGKNSFVITKEQQQQFFEDKLNTLNKLTNNITEFIDNFCKVKNIVNDKYGMIFYNDYDTYSLTELLEYADTTRVYTITQVFDYHW